MTELARLADLPLARKWCAQFRTARERGLASQLLGSLSLVSERRFEQCIEREIFEICRETNSRVAVYPVQAPLPDGVIGHDPFRGSITSDVDGPGAGKRRAYGSEDRLGQFLLRLQEKDRGKKAVSSIECQPTLLQLRTQKIRHVVLVDDISGSGRRLCDYWKRVVPKELKSLLSLHKIDLWIVTYTVTKAARSEIANKVPNFPIQTRLRSVVDDAGSVRDLSTEISEMLDGHSDLIGSKDSASLGFHNSSTLTIFEHGCPNNATPLLWKSTSLWSALFPNRSVPTELRPAFDPGDAGRTTEILWKTQQERLALALIAEMESTRRLSDLNRMLLVVLGLRLKGVPEADLPKRLLVSRAKIEEVFDRAALLGAYDLAKKSVTAAGRSLIDRFRNRFTRVGRRAAIGNSPWTYYPQQCEGKLLKSGKTAGIKSGGTTL